MPEPSRMLVFDGALSEAQAGVIRSIYCLMNELPEDVRRVVAKDLAVTYEVQRDGCGCGDPQTRASSP